MIPQATAGRIVHYYLQGGQHRAAIVGADTAEDGTACLTVFFDTGPSVVFGVRYSEQPCSACWSWMPYQKEKAKTERGNVSESAVETEPDSPRDIPAIARGVPDAGPGVSVDPVGGPPAGDAEAGEEGTTTETAVVDGPVDEADAADEPL